MCNTIYRSACFLFLAVVFLQACNAADKKKMPSDIVVAVVNGEEVRGDKFLKEYTDFKKRYKIADSVQKESENRLRDGVIKKIIDSVLLEQEAEKAGISIPKERSDQAAAEIIQGFSPARLQIVLEKSNKTLEDWKGGIHRNLVIEKLMDAKIASQVKIQDGEVKRYFRENPGKFKIPARVRAYHIVVPSLSQADELHNELLFGAKFPQLARRYSQSPDAENGGDLGVFAKGQMPQEFDNVLFKLKLNETSRVVESPYGYHLFKVVERFRPRAMKYAEAKEKIYNEMFYEQLEKRFLEWMQEAREKAQIVVYSLRLYQL